MCVLYLAEIACQHIEGSFLLIYHTTYIKKYVAICFIFVEGFFHYVEIWMLLLVTTICFDLLFQFFVYFLKYIFKLSYPILLDISQFFFLLKMIFIRIPIGMILFVKCFIVYDWNLHQFGKMTLKHARLGETILFARN